MGLTGSCNLFAPEMEVWLNPAPRIEHRGGTPRSLDVLLAAVQTAYPDRYGAWTLTLPRESSSVLIVRSEAPEGLVTVAVGPYTADIVASRYRDQTATSFIHDLHTELLAGASGRRVVGLLGRLLAVSVLSGLCLERPGRRSSAPGKRVHPRTFGVHRALGVYSFAILFTVALTGFGFVYFDTFAFGRGPESAEDKAHSQYENLRSTAVSSRGSIGLTAAVTMMRGLFPGAKVIRIATPANATGTYRVELCRARAFCSHHVSIIVWVNQ
jgi:uncharacterized iron-regulated membrane protein